MCNFLLCLVFHWMWLHWFWFVIYNRLIPCTSLDAVKDIWMYSKTLLNWHPLTPHTCNIMENYACPECIFIVIKPPEERTPCWSIYIYITDNFCVPCIWASAIVNNLVLRTIGHTHNVKSASVRDLQYQKAQIYLLFLSKCYQSVKALIKIINLSVSSCLVPSQLAMIRRGLGLWLTPCTMDIFIFKEHNVFSLECRDIVTHAYPTKLKILNIVIIKT